MNKEFEEKFFEELYDYMNDHSTDKQFMQQLWQWIEQQIKQARVDELEKILTISNSLGRNLYIAQQIERRIKELNET